MVLLTHFLHGGDYIQALNGFTTHLFCSDGFIQSTNGFITHFLHGGGFIQSVTWWGGGVITHLLHGDGFIWMVPLLTFSTVMVLPCSSLLLRHSMHLSASTTVDMVTKPKHLAPGLLAFVTIFAPTTCA